MTPTLLPRQSDDDIICSGYYCYSATGYIIKWIVFGAIVALILLYCLIGYFHAKSRMKKGLPFLRYNKWLIPRRRRIAYHLSHPELPNPYGAQMQRTWYTPGYGMHAMPPHGQYGPPPPVYGTPEYLPAYQPPADGSVGNAAKTNPDQGWRSQEGGMQGQGSAGRR